MVEVPTVRVPCTHVLSRRVMSPAGGAPVDEVEGLASMMTLAPVKLSPCVAEMFMAPPEYVPKVRSLDCWYKRGAVSWYWASDMEARRALTERILFSSATMFFARICWVALSAESRLVTISWVLVIWDLIKGSWMYWVTVRSMVLWEEGSLRGEGSLIEVGSR